MATSPVQIDPQTGERIASSGAVQIDPNTGERVSVPTPSDSRNGFQKMIDTAAAPDSPAVRASRGPVSNALQDFGRGATELIASPVAHPIKTIQSAGHLLDPLQSGSENPLWKAGSSVYHDFKDNGPQEAIPHTLGQVAGGFAGGKITEGVAEGIPKIGSALRTAAIGDPDAAAVSGLRVPALGKKVLPMQNAVQTARPFLKGASSLEDLQSRVPAAKSEIWSPYKQTVDAMGETPVKGPDGMTTIKDLENERRELSARNQKIKSGDPSEIQRTLQAGQNPADLLAREKLVREHLDPELEKYGIKPADIRQTYGSVAQIGKQIEGRSTLTEPAQPYGLGKLGSISMTKPLSAIPKLLSGGRDLVAGRPLFSGSPADIGIREGFANSGPKPNLGMFKPPAIKGLLEAPPTEIGLHDAPITRTSPGGLINAERFPAQNVGEARVIRNAKGQIIPMAERNMEFPDASGKLPVGRNPKGQMLPRTPTRQAWMAGSGAPNDESPLISGPGVLKTKNGRLIPKEETEK